MAKGDKDKPRGRMSSYAYFVQTCREEHKKKHPSENVVFAEFSKKCAERWKTMTDSEKKRFLSMAEKDKVRFDSEMSHYEPANGDVGGGKKRKRTKDPNAPKRALSAFFWFCSDERPKARELLGDVSVGEVAKELGRRWGNVTSELKSKYEALAAKDKARYEKEITAYKKKGGGPGVASKASPKKSKAADPAEDSDEEEEDDDE